MDDAERLEAAAKFLLQSPPGEINDVLNDVRAIISDDERLLAGILPALREYNVQQFTTAEIPGVQHLVIVSEAGQVPGEQDRFLDPRSRQSFVFDHLRLEASDIRSEQPVGNSEAFRAALDGALQTYIEDHFAEGVATVFAKFDRPTQFIIQIVSNKYNPPNFWSGRWRSEYLVDLDRGTVTGKIIVNVHYYEQGNVQLSTHATPSLSFPANLPASSANKIVAVIAEQEAKYQASLNDTYHEMGEKTFKALRRALPVTRNKIDWDKVTGYKLGQELNASRGVFGGPN